MSPPDPGRSQRGRVVLVTGASAGNGRAIALAAARSGATVVAVARSGDRLAALAGEDAQIDPLVADVTSAGDRVRIVTETLRRHGRLDALVNNAGVATVGLLEDLEAADIERVFATNVVAVADLTRLALPALRKAPRGDVVMISSVGAWAAVPPLTVYCASKFAVDGLVEGLRRELWRTGVRVHSVNPGPVSTEWLSRAGRYSPGERDELGRPSPGVSPERVAAAVLVALAAPRPRTLAVPRVLGIARLAQVPPVGALLDVVLGLAAGRVSHVGRRMVDRRTPDPAPTP